MFCLRTLRELKLLKFLSEAGVSENVRLSPCVGDPAQLTHRTVLIDYLHPRYHQTPIARSIQGSLPYVILTSRRPSHVTRVD